MQKACTKDENNTNETIKVFSKIHVRGQARKRKTNKSFDHSVWLFCLSAFRL